MKVKRKTVAYGKNRNTTGLLSTMMSEYQLILAEMSCQKRTKSQNNIIT